MKIYIGNMSFDTTEENLKESFGSFGEVTSINIITDNYSGKSKGFAFVEMSSKDEAIEAIRGLNGKEINGREVNVNEAKPRKDNGNRSGNNKFRSSY